ncbi:DMT family transporter [Neisseriaceae bacterium TC5R-5]|nr:DMT family transporter [Neisseriaceae bacterium TC5R-5]
MTTANLIRLTLLSAIWGSSFLFMRISVTAFGPALLIFARVGLAALFLLIIARQLHKTLPIRQHWRHFLLLGLFGSGLPFLLFAFAAQTVTASLLSILNATAPMWAVVIATVWQRKRLALPSLLGLLLGVLGVALLAGINTMQLAGDSRWALLAGLAAPFCYGIATVYTQSAPAVDPYANAHGSMWAATVLLAPLLLSSPLPSTLPSLSMMMAVVVLGVLCSGVAYLLYFRLIADIGAAPALTVTYLTPVFGILWGVLFLNESVGWHTLAGSLCVLGGTALVTGWRLPRRAVAS